jgi:HEAT repeat protein
LLAPGRTPGPGRDELTILWGAELNDAARSMSPEQVADAIQSYHGMTILRIAARRRALYILNQHRAILIPFLQTQITGPDDDAARRAFATIGEFQISELTDECMRIYAAGGPRANAAQSALTWIPSDPARARMLIDEAETNPEALKRHSMLIAIFLRKQPIDQRLLKYLDSQDADMRYAAANAVMETGDPMLFPLIPKLLDDTDARVSQIGVRLAVRAPAEKYQVVRPSLVKLLSSTDVQSRIDAAARLAAAQDPLAAPVLLEYVKQASLEPRHRSRVMQAVRALLGTQVRFNMASWGTDTLVITQLEDWIKSHPAK